MRSASVLHNTFVIDQEGHPRPPFSLTPAIAGSYEDTLAQAGTTYLLDLRDTPAGAVRTWLEGPHPFRVFNDVQPSEENPYHQAPLSAWFDVLVHLEHISPSRLLRQQRQ